MLPKPLHFLSRTGWCLHRGSLTRTTRDQDTTCLWVPHRSSLLQAFCWRQSLLTTLRQTILNGLRTKKFKARMASLLLQKFVAIDQTATPKSFVTARPDLPNMLGRFRLRPCVQIAKLLRTRCLAIGTGACPKLVRLCLTGRHAARHVPSLELSKVWSMPRTGKYLHQPLLLSPAADAKRDARDHSHLLCPTFGLHLTLHTVHCRLSGLKVPEVL